MQKTVSQGFRLSPRQQHVWWAQGGDADVGDDAAFIVRARIEISGPLDRRRLEQAVEKVVERHEILRTTFPLLPSLSVPVQSVEDSSRLDWTLETGPGDERHTLLLSQPALAADGVSLELLATEIAAAYHGGGGLIGGEEGEVLQYADLAEVLHDWEGSPADDPGPIFWSRQDVSALPRVTLGRGLPGGQPYRPEQVSRTIERGPVEQAAARLDATVTAVLLAAWHAALHLSTGEEEIVVGTLFDGRTFAELQGALGPFARYLPVRARTTADSTLAELGRDVSATLAEVARRQDYFSSASIERLLAEHGASGWPFGFDVHTMRRPRELPAPPGAPRFTIADVSLGLDRFGLRLSVLDDRRALRLDLAFDPLLFEPGEAGRLLDRFCRVLDGLLAGAVLGEIDALTAAERRELLAWNRTEAEVPAGLCAHHLFEEQAHRAPQAPALVHSGTAWTYDELNARANRLARHLRAAGVEPGALVGLLLERSPELVESVLGVLKAGAAYVPLDPGYPAERRTWMAEDARLSRLLTREWIETHRSEISRQSGDDLPDSTGPAGLAYVLYTSGSTGRPKGVMVPHRGLVNYLLWARRAYAAGEGAGAPVHTSIGFDLTVTSLLVPLAAGTAVRLLPEDPAALAAALRQRAGFSLVKLTPAHLTLLRRELRPEEHDGSTRALVIGGEALLGETVAPWREHAPRTRLINEYGPTEATVGCCVYEIGPGEATAGPVAIGRPIANTRLWVIGPRLQPVPPGAPGELWIGGDGLARGYLGRPDLTAERFVPDPFAAETGNAGGRLYRTGDLVRLRPPDQLEVRLEFLGRIDHQIKLRGFRIEPGEIEAALLGHGDVREAAVLAAEDPDRGTELVACVAGKAETGALRRHLLERLPEHMVPSRFASFDALPLTPNGKVDRGELARTWHERAEAAAEPAAGEAPRTWTEELLAGMFAELLGLPQVGRTESFFALGGHSLLATQAVSRVREAFGVEMSLRTFFEVPTVASLAGKVAELRSGGEAAGLPGIVPVPREEPLPLSFAQQRLWFIDQLEPGSPLYNIPVALRVEGPLQAAVLALCFGEIVRRHEVLRTVFAAPEGEPVQVILPPAPFALSLIDLSGLPENRREAVALDLIGEEAARPFDLTRGPLLRGTLLRMAPEDHVVLLTLHHIVSDGWSMGLLVREVAALYAAFAENRPSPLPGLPVQYADFAAWQRSWLHGEVLESEISWWRRQLADLPPLLELPADRPRPAVLSFRGATRPVRLPAGLTQKAQALGRREDATLFMVLLAAFQALLARWSGQPDLAVGSPVAGRNRTEIEGLIGFFVNTLVLRGDLSRSPTFRELLGRVRETSLSAYAHQDVPFEKLVQETSPERSLAHTPLFQVMLALQNAPVTALEIRSLRLRPVSGAGTTAKLDLLLSLDEWNGGLLGSVEHATDLFDAATIDRLTGHFERLLTAALEAPDLGVPDLPLLPDSERHQVLSEWNDTTAGPSEETLIHELFEAWTARAPEATAVVCGDESMTYGELEEQANRLAHHLRGRGIGPGSLVGIHLRRGLPMIPALLAVLKAGAAYVPLEVGHPPARLRWILDTLEISCVLTETDVIRPIGPIRPIRPISSPDDLAYIIFTSGSTGTPKGVMVRHRPVINLIRWAHRTFAFSPGDRVLFVASLSFDLSVFDVFGLLAAGGSIRIATEEEVRDPERLLRALAGEPITFWDSAPAALEQTVPFLDDMDPQARPALRLVFLSGDWIPVTLPDRIRPRFPGAQVVSLGGATEATVWSNVFPVGVVDPVWTSIPYGRPIDNARYHVLDEALAPCPVGVPGDLYIGGGCLADGYAREPELTASKFLPDPWSAVPGGRLYRTGDRARHRPDGNLEFLGRRDTQVKIRGFRIELGEIEATLAILPGVREAVAAVRDGRLVAYVVGDAPAAALREALRERLPDPMVPAAFVALAALPITPNGKVDRKALPAPEWHGTEATYLPPRTPVEEVLAGIWAEVLGLERIGANDHFFDLGGHSLLATRVMARVRGVFGIELPLRDLFEAPTLASLAARIAATRQAGAVSQAPPLGSIPREGSLPLSFAQERLWFLDRLQPNSPFYNLPLAIEMRGTLSVPALAASLNEVVRRHEVLRTTFPFVAGTPVQAVAPVLDVTPPVVDLGGLGGLPGPVLDAEVARLTRSLAARPFDLATGPLLRSALLRRTRERHVVLFSMHHIVSDGWSMALLMQEVAELYRAAASAVSSPLPDLPVQYADFALWQRASLSGTLLEEQTGWWRRNLAGAPQVLDLPTDRPRPAVQSLRGAHDFAVLPAGLAHGLRELSLRQNVTPFMTWLALFGALLHRYTGAGDLLIGSPIAGRNHTEIEPLIGLFVNTLVLRVEMEGDPALIEVLGRVRDRTLGAYAHQDLPFEKLVEELHPERSLAHTPLFQVMLVQQDVAPDAAEIPGLDFLPLPAESGAARFDLHLALADAPSGLLADMEYNRDLFDPATITRLLGHLRLLAEGAVRNPRARLSELPLLSDRESHQIRLGWNDTGAQRRTGLTLQELFSRQAARSPAAPAVAFEERTLTYRELDLLSGRLAARLLALGVRPDTAVGVLMERSVEMVVALLGVLKAGAAYLPLDPEHPAERLGWVLADARVKVLLAQERLLPALPAPEVQVICLEAGWEGDGEPGSSTGLSDRSLAYVLYTSGSTGRPKGVMIPHQGIVNRLLWMQEAYGLTAEDRVLQKTPYGFDVSVWEFFWPLITGACLVVAIPGGHRDAAWLTGSIERERITVAHFVPSMLQAFLEEPDLSGCASLRLVVASGEALTPELRRRFGERLDARLENLYGPTEASVDVTSWNCSLEARGGIVPIGRPVANTSIHVLDRSLRPVPIGIPGELAIGGVQLARGYLDRPDLTAERFIPDPDATAGDRLYRTGDLARYLPDGALEYLGRLDFQVKIRGFRIELGEIEAALSTVAGVREAVAVVREDATGDRRLVAYVTGGATADEMRRSLRELLPDYVIPGAFVTLEALPLTANGKVDRKALPAPGSDAARAHVAPGSPLEQVVAGIWAELLKVERVGLADNFFDLGGDSIKAVRLVSRVNERLGADLRVQDVFKHQTVGPLAERIATRLDRSQADDLAAGRVAIERLQRAVLADERQRAKLPEGWEDFFPLSGIEKGMVYYTLLLPEQPVYHDQHVYVLSIPDLGRFYRALELVTGRHPILRSGFHLDAFAEPMKVVHRSIPVVRDVEDLSGLPAAEQRARIERYRAEDLRHRFVFQGEVLWRLKIFRLGGETCATVWTWHHAILDGWSNLSLWLDLNELLAREDLDRIEAVAPLASSYKDYLAITLGRSRSPATEDFWRALLAGAGRNKLPFQRPASPAREDFGMRSLQRPLSPEVRLGLRERAAELHVPLQALFLAAHLHLLRLTSGEEDVITGVVSHDRPGIPDGDKIVGCFLNTFPLRLRLEPGESGASLARRVARYLAEEKEHEIPLVDIAGLVGLRESAQNPLFDTLLNFMDFHLIEEVRDNALFHATAGEVERVLPELRLDEMTNTLFDLEVMATQGRPFLQLKYLPRYFEETDVERALDLYGRILETLIRGIDAPLAAEALLSAEERGQLVAVYNDTARAYPRQRPLHSFFEERAALHPDFPAVLCGGRSLTYGELDRMANRVARLLLARGVEPGDNVGVCLERSPELVAALFGVLKAGAAYVPLEPSYPQARKDWIARQSAISFLLEGLPEDLDSFADAPVPLRPRPEDLAYTIYTSGSTGTPKGVMIAHHSAVNLIGWVNREMAVGPGDRVLMVSSVGFDLSVYDVFGTLAAGGAVVLARQEEVQEPAALLRLVVEQEITFWNSVPSTLGLLVQYLEETDPGFRGETLRLAFLSGDWIPLALPERARRLFPNLRVISLGGATEATVWSIFHPVGRIDEAWLSIPYGRPLDNNTFYVLDRHLELVPPGVVGDLWIGGTGVARGYAGDPEKTAASCLPDPFTGPGRRLYRTGDLGRMLPQGEIEFLGRSDHQVKVRGFRIELGEIESQLSRAPGVREAVVLARGDRTGQKTLCAYVVASGEAGEDVSIAAIQEHLARSLPGYMIPDTFVFLSTLPLSANGKIDRKALPEPELVHASGAAHVAPANATEEILVGIWEEVLGLSGLGTGHDFFALGGHSLTAIQVLTRVRRLFEVDLPLPDFFEDPTIPGLAAAVERLRGARVGSLAPPLVASPREAPPPLSFAQERLWFLDQLEPESALYNIPVALRIEGPLDWRVLALSLGEIVRRHEALRTVFAVRDGLPVQVIRPAAPFAVPVVDLSGLPGLSDPSDPSDRSDLKARQALALAATEAGRPFDLSRGPLLRGLLLRLAESEHAAVFTMHHIASDAWSIGILVREFTSLYAAFSEGQPSPLPELPVHYTDFAIWQRSWLQGEALESEIAFWRRQLAGLPPLLELPTDRPRPAAQSFRGSLRPVRLPAELVRQMEALGRREGATLFMVLLAGFQSLLARYSGQQDLAVGTPVAGRNQVETEGLIGFFVNTLVMRGDGSGRPSFRELLGRVRTTALAAYTHQDVPFEKLVQELAPERSLAHSPLFQVMLVLQNAPLESLEIPGLRLRPFGGDGATAKFDLTLSLGENFEGGLSGSVEYATDLFDAATIDRLIFHYERLLAGMAGEPERRVDELDLLTPEEVLQLRAWNETTTVYPLDRPLHAWIEDQVDATPDAVAIDFEGEALTYRELDRRANRLARRLRARGCGPESRVGVLLERSCELLVTLLGILKAGAAYVPLDPEHPADRLAFQERDAGLSLVLTRRDLAGDPAGDARPAVPIDPDCPAYVLYTSGSTGRPKGVVISHRAIANRLLWMQDALHLTPTDRVLQKTPFSFDVSVWELFWPLMTGARLVVASPGGHRDNAYLVRLIAEQGITVLHFVPSMLQLFLEDPGSAECRTLRDVVCSGEALPAELARRFTSRLGRARLHNLYGPTEAAVDVTSWVCGEGDDRAGAPIGGAPIGGTSIGGIPIGRPIANTRIHLLGSGLLPVPVGVPGELFIAGINLARGYVGRPDLTAERFLPDPTGGEPGGRVYRTGDLARWRNDGAIEFLGRIDHQVKIRGFRIELGEIEAVLLALEGVRDAVVVAREEPGGRRLAAYLVGDATPEALRQALRERLPDYMVPAAFVMLPALPLTPNGKVDRKALPAPDRRGPEEGYLAPRTRPEEILADIWAQVLRLPRVGVQDNFFALGGDSILSIQIVARARQAGLHLTVRQLFEHQTVARLARHARALATSGAAGSAQGPVAGEVPLTPIQRWFFSQDFTDLHHFNQALLLEPGEPLSPAALERAMATVVEHHDALRLRFRRQGEAGGWRQDVAAALPVLPFHRIDLSSLPAACRRETLERAAAALQTGFDLTAGPLTRLARFETGAGEPELLLWVAHHLVVDAVSWRVLLEDLEGAYRQAARGLRPALPARTVSFREWALRLADCAGSGALARELDHWLDAARAVPRLPVDFPESENTLGTEAEVSFALTAEETADLLQAVPAVFRNRIDEALLSALARALAGWTGSPRLRVDLEGHGREPLPRDFGDFEDTGDMGDVDDLDTSRTVGWFTTVHPVILEAGDAGPGEALVSAKERLRAVPGHGIGYGLLRYLRDGGDGDAARLLAAAPAAEISFNYLGQLDATSGALSLFRPSLAIPGATRSPRIRRTHLLEVRGLVAGGRLRMSMTYGARVHRRETVERLAAAYAGALRELIRHSRTREDEVFSPADFPRAALDVRGFDKLAALLAARGTTLKDVEEIYPLSPLQNGLLFHCLLAPESGVYVNQLTCTLPADLDPRRFRQAWETLVERHGVLRTAFFWDGLDQPVQVVQKKFILPWRELDWRGLSADEQRRRLEELRRSDRSTPLSLSEPPLMRFSLVRLDREIGFLWSFQHLLLDGWSLPLLIQELGAIYAALQEGRTPALPPVRPFSDYIVWLRRQGVIREGVSRAEPFWRRELAGFAAANRLGIDRPAAAAGSAGYAEHELAVSRGVTGRLQALAARHSLTLQTVTLGAWAMLLGRYSGAEDVVFGCVVSGRPAALPGVESMIGIFINTLPVRVQADGGAPLVPWLRHLQERQLARSEHEHTPLSDVQRWSEVPAGSPLFETLYVFENYPTALGPDSGGPGSPGSLRAGDLRSFEPTNYPVTLALAGGDRIALRMTYDRARLEGVAALRLLHHLAALLSDMAEETDRPLRELALLSASERHQLLVEWRGRGGQPPAEPTLHRGFEAHAREAPEAPALTWEGASLSYGELNRRSNRLARWLRGRGVGPESRVGLCLQRSPDLVVGILGVLKAGGAYVPLDPGAPRERLAYIVEDAGVQIVVGEKDVHGELLEALPADDLEPLADGTSLAYVIYTSGSTGRPKGVLVTHGNVPRLFAATEAWFGFTGRDIWTLFHSYAFDFSVWEIWGALLYGGRLVIVPHDVSRSPELFLDLLVRERVTVLNQTPSAFAQLARVDEERGGVTTDLRLVIFGGEALDPGGLAPWFARHGDATPLLVNMYGITETTVHVTCRPLRAADARGERRSVIGVPIPDLTLSVLDPSMQPVPIGVPGELVVGGAGVARGYLGRPELTAERFVPDPMGDPGAAPGARLYRSGDLGRFLPHGEVEYLGRIDHQVKIRGFRIELGEIEAVLLALPGVREAVVVAREEPADRRLVAYLVGDATPEALREGLRERLPDYMVPAAFVTLAALPLTPNGKVDRKALPAPEGRRSEEGYLAPRTPAEEILAGIWAEVLGLERAGASDHFFDLGGHSLLAIRLVAAVRDAFRVDFPVRLVFEHPVLAVMARAISETEEAGAPVDDPVIALPREPGENRFPVSFSQLREWILDRLEPGNPAYNIASPLRIEGPLSTSVLTEALQGLVRRHEVFRTRFAAGRLDQEPEPLQIVHPDVLLEVPVIDLSALPESERDGELRRQARAEAATGFDLYNVPLLRTRIVRLAPEDHALLLTVHHIVTDGWSMGLLHQNVAALYEAAVSPSSPPLAPLPVQYADYAVWQRRRLSGEALDRLEQFWRQRLSGAPPLLELPTDRLRPPVRSSRGGQVEFHLPQPLAGHLRELARRRGATPFMLLLAGYQTLLARWSGQDDVVVGTYTGNRPRRELETLIGFFINTLALRTGLADAFAALLGRVRESTLGAYAHADLPFEKLLETLQVPRDPSRTPLFQALLVLQNFPPTRTGLSTGVRLSSLPVASEKADYDLELWLGEETDGITGTFKYSASLFDEATIARFAGQLRTLLEAAVADPERNLWTLPLITGEEETLQLQAWSRGPAVPEGSSLLHRLIEEQAARTPGAVALEAGGLRLTYTELIERAGHLARQLRTQGIGPGAIVALNAERTPELIISMLAVLQAGAAYLPLDPAYPRERREHMLADSGAVALKDDKDLKDLKDLKDANDRSFGSFAFSPESPAYLLYTSGSTGLPKGVVVPHRAITSFVRTAREAYGLVQSDRVLQFSSLSFDTSAEEIWPTLASGATLVLRPEDMAASIPHFLRELERLGITVLDLPTAFWHELVAGMAAEDLALPRDLRLVILGGEEARADSFALWRRRAGSAVRLVNTYGPTETTIVATRRELTDLAAGGLVPIGRPIAGARAYVLDRFFTPVPPGVRGELWIGGAGVSRGYLGRPSLTAERFVPDPFGDEPGGRLYRTGDLAYLTPDGDLVYAGRADRQLKIRGYRVEPGEIEAALRLHPALRDAVVDVRGARDASRLIAWIVPHDGIEAPGAPDLRAFLRDRLPEPLVPAAYVPLAALPLGPTRKVDRRALPEPVAAAPEGEAYAEPRSALERTIADVYRDLLRIARIGLHDNFFDLGGHSLLIVRAHQRLKEELGREIPVLDLFRFPTVASLARHLEGEETGTLSKVRELAERQREAQQRQRAAIERLRRPGGPARR